VEVRIDDAQDLFGLELRIRFDPSLLEVIDSDPSTPATVQLQPGDVLSGSAPF
jgi:hypothetical protein